MTMHHILVGGAIAWLCTALFAWSLCVAAGRADRDAERARRERGV